MTEMTTSQLPSYLIFVNTVDDDEYRYPCLLPTLTRLPAPFYRLYEFFILDWNSFSKLFDYPSSYPDWSRLL